MTSEEWKLQLTSQTDVNGGPGTDFGPYLSLFVTNPFNNSERVLIDADGTARPGTLRTSGPYACGWYFNAVTGRFAANDSVEHGRW